MSAGWQSSTVQIRSKVLNRMARALPVFSIDKLAGVMSTRSESSLSDILRCAITVSKFTIIISCGVVGVGWLDGKVLLFLHLIADVEGLGKEEHYGAKKEPCEMECQAVLCVPFGVGK